MPLLRRLIVGVALWHGLPERDYLLYRRAFRERRDHLFYRGVTEFLAVQPVADCVANDDQPVLGWPDQHLFFCYYLFHFPTALTSGPF
ncbi:MAG: hypothetical protein HGB34_00170 [Candidatus Moranbacteria bacterium]|nr:hypothetical protein [Candidatus Moranbacteria bacterium]